MEIQEFQKQLLAQGKTEGFSDCEVFFQGGTDFEVLVLDGEISHYENSARQGVCFRGIWQGKMGYAYSEKISKDAIGFLLKQAKENASVVEETVCEELFEGVPTYPTYHGFSKTLQGLSHEQKIDAAKKMEQAALEQGGSQVAIDYCILGYGESKTQIQNTKGLSVSYEKNGVSAYVSAIAQKNQEIKTGSEYWMEQNWEEFDPFVIGKQATRNAVSHLGAKSIASGEYAVVLENLVMSGLLSAFCTAFYGETVQKGFSILGGKQHHMVASPEVSLRDDALLSGKPSSCPCDSEGVPCQNKAVISHGRLETFLYNLKSAEAAHVVSTGNGFKASLQSPVKTACTNFYVVPGETSKEALLGQLQEGLLITEITGLHAGANAISGDFSLSAEGFLVEQGQKTAPVEQITIAGNFFDVLQQIVACGNDLRFDMPGNQGTMGSPSVLVKKISISGL